jgi:flagellum-specific ATP synthase
MHGLSSPEHFNRVRRFRQLYSRYQRNRDLVSVGAYVPGSDPQLDVAIAAYPRLEAFLQQDMQQQAQFADSVGALARLIDDPAFARTAAV